MNERIRELVEQVGIQIEFDDYGEIRMCEAYGSSFIKFAELIVRKCAGIAFDEYAATNGAASGESAILKHFGVTE